MKIANTKSHPQSVGHGRKLISSKPGLNDNMVKAKQGYISYRFIKMGMSLAHLVK